MPMLITFLMLLPVCPFQAPLRTRSANSAILSEHGVHVRHDVFPSTVMLASRGARRATCSTARFSVMLIFSPRNIASMRAFRPDSSASCSRSFSVSSVTRFFE